jgi:L-lactate dehydrogenase complex protein LldG
MIDSSASKQAILSKIRGHRAVNDREVTAAEYARIERTYERNGSRSSEERIDLFEERLREYDAQVHRITEKELPAAIAAAITRRTAQRIAIPDGFPASWLLPSMPASVADGYSNGELDQVDGLISGCTLAIALTGTIVLQNVPGQGPRRLSLIPDYHLCVVFTDQVVETVPEALDRLAATATLPTTFISGPSATADIEMTRIKGVHGPRFLEVLIAERA